MSLTTTITQCHQCHEEFDIPVWRLEKQRTRNKDGHLFCSRKCWGLSRRVQRFARVRECHNCHKAFFVSTRESHRLKRPRIFCSKVCSSSYTTRQRKQEEVKIIFAKLA